MEDNMQLSEIYQWEIETADRRVISQYKEDGSEVPSTTIPIDQVVRASIIARIGDFPRHDILIDLSKGEKFIKHFGRGMLKDNGGGYRLAEYLHCIETSTYRLWVFSSNGQSLVTNKECEIYI